MEIKIEKTFRVDAPVEEVWALLTDPERMVACIPGADLDQVVDARTFRGRLGLKMGPVRASYQGEARFEELDAERYRMRLVGSGTGDGGASVTMTGQLRALDDGGTESSVVAEVNVAGRLTPMRSRLMRFVSDELFRQFVTRFQKQLEASQREA